MESQKIELSLNEITLVSKIVERQIRSTKRHIQGIQDVCFSFWENELAQLSMEGKRSWTESLNLLIPLTDNYVAETSPSNKSNIFFEIFCQFNLNNKIVHFESKIVDMKRRADGSDNIKFYNPTGGPNFFITDENGTYVRFYTNFKEEREGGQPYHIYIPCKKLRNSKPYTLYYCGDGIENGSIEYLDHVPVCQFKDRKEFELFLDLNTKNKRKTHTPNASQAMEMSLIPINCMGRNNIAEDRERQV